MGFGISYTKNQALESAFAEEKICGEEGSDVPYPATSSRWFGKVLSEQNWERTKHFLLIYQLMPNGRLCLEHCVQELPMHSVSTNTPNMF